MALKARQGVFRLHALSVVGHAEQPAPAFFHIDRDPVGSRVERILHQLLDDRCRTLDNLTRRDAVGDIVG